MEGLFVVDLDQYPTVGRFFRRPRNIARGAWCRDESNVYQCRGREQNKLTKKKHNFKGRELPINSSENTNYAASL